MPPCAFPAAPARRAGSSIAWPAPTKQNTGAIHGSAAGADEVRATKELLDFDPDAFLRVPACVMVGERDDERDPELRQGRGARQGASTDAGAALRAIAYDPCLAALVLLDGPSRVPAPGGIQLGGEPIGIQGTKLGAQAVAAVFVAEPAGARRVGQQGQGDAGDDLAQDEGERRRPQREKDPALEQRHSTKGWKESKNRVISASSSRPPSLFQAARM